MLPTADLPEDRNSEIGFRSPEEMFPDRPDMQDILTGKTPLPARIPKKYNRAVRVSSVVGSGKGTNSTNSASSNSFNSSFSYSKDDKNWPSPLAPEAYHGIAGDFIRTFEPYT